MTMEFDLAFGPMLEIRRQGRGTQDYRSTVKTLTQHDFRDVTIATTTVATLRAARDAVWDGRICAATLWIQ